MKRALVVLLLLLAAASVLGRLAWRAWRGREVTLKPVATGRVVAAVYATGRVDTDRRATLRARVAAPLLELRVGPGQPVREGTVVGRQDPTALRLSRERAERDLEAFRASLAEAEDTATRSETLVRQGLLAEDVGVQRRERARELRAQAAGSESALALAREQEGWAVLRAPLSGTVSVIVRRAGDPLREGDEVLTVVELSLAYVRVAVDERDVGRVRPEQEVRMVFDAYPGRVLTGSVWRIVPAVDRLTKSTDVLVRLPAERPPLQLDLTATVNIVTGVVEAAPVVPRDALEGAGDQRAVYSMTGHQARRRPVEVGVCDERRCQVIRGLGPGDAVIAPLPPGIRDGERVSVP